MLRNLALASLMALAFGCAGTHRQKIEQSRTYALSDLTVKPKLINRGEVYCELLSLTPLALRHAGTGGTTTLDLTINTHGRVERARLYRSSGMVTIDKAAFRIASMMRFSPGRVGGLNVPTRFALPLELAILETQSSLPRPRTGHRGGCDSQ